ncbi:MAG: XRE family transcriptional regulator [Betaproteobacteria bacterium]|nr:MAG: XRE family transcriptional regulator [Betaproteobacteria bacterium]
MMATTKRSNATDLVARGRQTKLGGITSGIGSGLSTALSMMKTAGEIANNASTALKVAQSIGSTIKATREVQQLSLNDLAKRAGVSKSVVSRIEQGLTSPTAVMLAKLAEGMTVSLTSLLRGESGPPIHIQSAAEQPTFKDPKTGLIRRTLSPVSPDAQVEIVHNTLPARKETGKFPAHNPGTQEHIVVLAGKIEVSLGRRNFTLNAGDAAQFAADTEHSIKNLSTKKSEWYLVIHSPPRMNPKIR